MTGRRSGNIDLPLHGGRVRAWLGQCMTRLGAIIVEECARSRDFGGRSVFGRESPAARDRAAQPA